MALRERASIRGALHGWIQLLCLPMGGIACGLSQIITLIVRPRRPADALPGLALLAGVAVAPFAFALVPDAAAPHLLVGAIASFVVVGSVAGRAGRPRRPA